MESSSWTSHPLTSSQGLRHTKVSPNIGWDPLIRYVRNLIQTFLMQKTYILGHNLSSNVNNLTIAGSLEMFTEITLCIEWCWLYPLPKLVAALWGGKHSLQCQGSAGRLGPHLILFLTMREGASSSGPELPGASILPGQVVGWETVNGRTVVDNLWEARPDHP